MCVSVCSKDSGTGLTPGHVSTWEAIDITSVSSRRLPEEFDRINSQVHRRLGGILDEIQPDWREHYVLVPALRVPHESPLPHRLP
jgi:hypothetical protein